MREARSADPVRVLFVCSHDSARGQMAESRLDRIPRTRSATSRREP